LVEPILKSGNSMINLKAAGPSFPLGMLENNLYQQTRVPLKSDDILILQTDGIVEAQNPGKELYGEERLENLLKEMGTPHLSAGAIKNKIIEDVQHFAGTATQFDDMTLVVVKIA